MGLHLKEWNWTNGERRREGSFGFRKRESENESWERGGEGKIIHFKVYIVERNVIRNKNKIKTNPFRLLYSTLFWGYLTANIQPERERMKDWSC